MTTFVRRTVLLSDLVDDLVADNEAAAAARAAGRPRGPITSLPQLDEGLGGYLAPGVHLLQAAPGVGKTSLTLQIASECAFPALVVSAEMPVLELFRRLIARATLTFLGRLKTGELSSSEMATLALRTVQRFPMLALQDATIGQVSPSDMVEAASALRERMEASSVLLVVDSLQTWARISGASRKDASEYDAISEAVAACREVSARLNAPLLAVNQRNRAGQAKGGLHAGKGSGDLEYAAESVLELTPDAADRNTDEEKRVTLSIHKNRHGGAGIEIPLWFSGRLQRFREV